MIPRVSASLLERGMAGRRVAQVITSSMVVVVTIGIAIVPEFRARALIHWSDHAKARNAHPQTGPHTMRATVAVSPRPKQTMSIEQRAIALIVGAGRRPFMIARMRTRTGAISGLVEV